MSEFRVLKLTDREVELITTALGIAEKTYTDLHKRLVEVVNVRGGELTANTDFHHISCKFADLNNDIENSKKDV
jgi:hypothetical protein